MADMQTLARDLELGDILDIGGKRPDGRGQLEGRVHEFADLVAAKQAKREREARETLEAHEKEVKELRKEAQETIRKLRAKVEKLEAKVKELKDRERHLKTRVKELAQLNEGRGKELDRKRDELEKTIDVSADVSHKLREQLERAIKDKEEWKTKEAVARAELKEEKSQHDLKKRELAKKTDEFNQIKKVLAVCVCACGGACTCVMIQDSVVDTTLEIAGERGPDEAHAGAYRYTAVDARPNGPLARGHRLPPEHQEERRQAEGAGRTHRQPAGEEEGPRQGPPDRQR
jgi:ABC-type transporter Mla subunit MlaD